MSIAEGSEISATSSKSFEDALKESGRLITWSSRGRTYVPVPTAASRGMGRLDEDRAHSMTDEGGPPLDEKRACSMVDEVAAAATWHWDLASGRVEWDERLKALFGYAEMVTDAAWRVNRIHPEDRERVEVSLHRAAIVNHGAVWWDQYRFRQADGSYAIVTESACVVHDDAGPRWVLGAINRPQRDG